MFGQPIGSNQAIQFMIADMQMRVHTRGWPGATPPGACGRGKPFKPQAAIAKLSPHDAAMDNAREATQIFGGNGFMNEYPRRPALPRLEDPRDRRGHQRGAAHADRP